jgi:signal transduction histidine kinase/serine phosphatase RsbU (regulator of sigma subunit)
VRDLPADVSDAAADDLRRQLARAERRVGQLERKLATLDRIQQANYTVGVNLYRELQEARERLLELDRAKSRFFANVSHELRTPLTLSIGPLELLARRADLPPDVVATVRRVLESKHRLLKQINELLDLASLDAGAARATFRQEDVAFLVRVWTSTARTALEGRKIRLDLDVPGEPVPVWLDRARFETVFMNVLSNACKFTPDGGRIRVTVAAGEGEVRVAVADSGPGIAPADQDRIFERFTQVDGSDTRRHRGTGIGLALVRELMQLHGGRVAVASALGEGSTFTLTFLAGNAHLDPGAVSAEAAPPPDALAVESWLGAAAEAPEAPAVEAPADAPTVLVVEDNAEMRAFLLQLLRPDFRVRVATDGVEGLAAAEREAPDVVLSDVQMPRMSGHELLRALRAAAGPLATTPVVLLTAQAGSHDKLAGLGQGADDYVVKPFHPDELVYRVRNLARLRRQERALAATVAALEARNRALDEDLAQARAFQQAILPALPLLPGVRVGAVYRPADVVGGDFYDVHAAGGRLRVFVADATGHGVQASLRTMVVRTVYERHRDAAGGPAELLARVNDDVVRAHGPLQVRLAAACLDLEPAGGGALVTYANAALPPVLTVRGGAAGEEYEAGPFLGMLPGLAFATRRFALGPGDRLVAYTDGLAEQWSATGERLADADLARLLAAPGPIDAVLGAAEAALHAWRGGRPPPDDVTAVGIDLVR